jgi:high frequency lysogenization protein
LQDNLYKTTIAIAGMIQAVSLVKDLAQTGKADEAAFKASIQSIFITDPEDFISVYGDLRGIKLGLERLVTTFAGEPKNGRSLLRHVMSLIHLEKKIRRSSYIQEALKKRIEQAKKQAEYFHSTHSSVIANLADCYLNAISTFRFRIIIWGNPHLLNSMDVMEKIRALLLTGIRSAVLWRQLGGSRLHLLFSRSKIKAMAEKILREMPALESTEKEYA